MKDEDEGEGDRRDLLKPKDSYLGDHCPHQHHRQATKQVAKRELCVRWVGWWEPPPNPDVEAYRPSYWMVGTDRLCTRQVSQNPKN